MLHNTSLLLDKSKEAFYTKYLVGTSFVGQWTKRLFSVLNAQTLNAIDSHANSPKRAMSSFSWTLISSVTLNLSIGFSAKPDLRLIGEAW